MSTVYALAHHADYRCRHTGACCRAGWRIPVEPERLTVIRDGARAGRLPAAAARVESDGALTVLALQQDGACAAYEPPAEGAAGRCAVHRTLGHDALPAACRHFPRVSVRDARGTHVTLSHFCPTAAATLFREDVPVAIVRNPSAFPASAEYEGLDARDVLPPLLRPGMLLDLDGYAAWERHAVATLGAEEHTVVTALEQLSLDAAALVSWTPGDGPPTGRIEELAMRPPGKAPRAGACQAAGQPFAEGRARRYADVCDGIPPDLQPARLPDELERVAGVFVEPAFEAFRTPVKRYLAGKAFASWIPWQASGLEAVVEWLWMCLSVVYTEALRQCFAARRPLDAPLLLEAFRHADLLVVHRASWARLAAAASGRSAAPRTRRAVTGSRTRAVTATLGPRRARSRSWRQSSAADR